MCDCSLDLIGVDLSDNLCMLERRSVAPGSAMQAFFGYGRLHSRYLAVASFKFLLESPADRLYLRVCLQLNEGTRASCLPTGSRSCSVVGLDSRVLRDFVKHLVHLIAEL
mmetsp:Transcript_14595/g.46550  ORF Transcript_14595/g.46550 Transcript_14595/m.46550 type:complete len:110 (+) Transcript_14595:574-903(+)